MSRIFWDTMLFVYLTEGHTEFAPLVGDALEHSYRRGDTLLTSHLALGEVMAGGDLATREVAIDEAPSEVADDAAATGMTARAKPQKPPAN